MRAEKDEGTHEVLQSLTETGRGTGVEVEADDADARSAQIDTPFDPDKIDVTTRSTTVDLLLSRTRSEAIDLQPDFQRKAGIWDEQRRSRLIESLLLRIPLPTLYAAEDEEENWAIVDGIQRLTSIVHFMESNLIDSEPLRLRDLEYLGDQYNGKTYTELPSRLQLRLRETELVVHLIRRGTPEPVKFNIFARINTGGLPLSNQELRHALIAGPIRSRLERLATGKQFTRATTFSVRDDRMADREMTLRFLAFNSVDIKSYNKKDFDAFLTERMQFFNSMSAEEFERFEDGFNTAMDRSREIFGKFAFRKLYFKNSPRLPINKALFEAVAVNLANIEEPVAEQLIKRKRECIDEMINLMDDVLFLNAISSGTGDSAKVRLRFSRIASLFGRVAA